MAQLLFLGSEGAGKSFLIRQLKQKIEKLSKNQNISTNDSDLFKSDYVKPTVGVDLVTVDSLKSYGYELQLREVGSTMLAKWTSYYSECDAVLVVVDISDTGSFALSYTLILEILSHQYELFQTNSTSLVTPSPSHDVAASSSLLPVNQKPIVLVCNKMDIANETNLSCFMNIIRFHELKSTNITGTTDIILMTGSALDSSVNIATMNNKDNNLVQCLIEWISGNNYFQKKNYAASAI
jgi:GTPase SAR1 family protein